MARQKNRGYQEFSPSYSTPTRTARRWKMASYIRLSKEDLQKIKKGLDCSNSVKNQRDILNYFYQSHVEEFESVAEYTGLKGKGGAAKAAPSRSLKKPALSLGPLPSLGAVGASGRARIYF